MSDFYKALDKLELIDQKNSKNTERVFVCSTSSNEEMLQNLTASYLMYLITKFHHYASARDGFNDSRRSLEDEERQGRPLVVDNEALKQAVESIQPSLHVRSQSGKSAPISSAAKKAARVAIAGILVRKTKNSGFYDSIVTSDEKWIQHDNTTRKR
ncbi:unnamed protein product [Heligmosomoides polygyrus]|uniref:Nuclear nucleic acid-binding protein C1D n=1 Tax=Heligmosomoides polygyrus TaxID=6339 RepID=A0A183F8P5_HELPZ|nr:unnamed protein product [Heligmosomoides polygyrus]